MEKFQTSDIPKSPRIQKLVDALYEHMPVIESARAKLITESYKETEGEPIITRRAKAFAHILHNIPIIIRDNELIVGSSTIAPRGCQTFPEFSYEWLEAELDTVATRTADPFEIAEETKAELKEADKYWKGKTTSELATSYMAPEAIKAIEDAGGQVIAAASIVDRSAGAVELGVPFFPLIELNFPTYAPDELPAELAATEAVKPGSRKA